MIELKNEPLAKYCTFKIGGEATILFPETLSELALLIADFAASKKPYHIFGNCSNVLFPDSGVGFTAVITTKLKTVLVHERKITAECGASLNSLAIAARDAGLTGLEFAYGIPGTVGGGLFMNAGAYGGQLSDVVCGCTAVTKDGLVQMLTADEMELGYRESVFQKSGLIVLEVFFTLREGDKEQIGALMSSYMDRRKKSQPLEYPSAGSVFKRPVGHFAGALIECANLKGLNVGGAQVSQKHAGFIVNKGNATARDVRELINLVKERVKENSGVVLESEIRIIEETE